MLPAALLRLAVKGFRDRRYWLGWGQRLGWIPTGPAEIWLHAVSVGEVRAARPVVCALLQNFPKQRVLITTSTPTGHEQSKGLFGDSVLHGYAPYDTVRSVRRFLDRIRPRSVFIMETELWPVIFDECRQRAISLVIVNARLSERSFLRYCRFPNLAAETLAGVRTICAQSAADAERFLRLGARPSAVHVTGNLKFYIGPVNSERPVMELRAQLGEHVRVLIAVSTHEGEEDLVLGAYTALRQLHESLVLVLAPRHPARASSVTRMIRARGLSYDRRSEGAPHQARSVNVLLLDTLGELAPFLALAESAFVGGSLVPIGGHNVLEACAEGVPVIFGPHMFNFKDIAELVLHHGAGTQVKDGRELLFAWKRYLQDKEARTTAGRAGLELIQRNQRAVRQTLDAVLASVSAE